MTVEEAERPLQREVQRAPRLGRMVVLARGARIPGKGGEPGTHRRHGGRGGASGWAWAGEPIQRSAGSLDIAEPQRRAGGERALVRGVAADVAGDRRGGE